MCSVPFYSFLSPAKDDRGTEPYSYWASLTKGTGTVVCETGQCCSAESTVFFSDLFPSAFLFLAEVVLSVVREIFGFAAVCV